MTLYSDADWLDAQDYARPKAPTCLACGRRIADDMDLPGDTTVCVAPERAECLRVAFDREE